MLSKSNSSIVQVFINSFLLVALLSLVQSCEDGSDPIPPTPNTPSTPTPPQLEYNQAKIGAQGGVLEITKAGDPLLGVKIEIPAGALTEEIQFDINLEENPPLDQEVFKDPVVNVTTSKEVEFKIPVKITFPITTTDSEVIFGAFYNEELEKWELMLPVEEITDNKVTFETTHFSIWTALGLPWLESSTQAYEFIIETYIQSLSNSFLTEIENENDCSKL